jgi:glycosyltransferase involved in cell wall biosynthesis
MSNVAVLTVPREQVSWIPKDAKNTVFIPVGANLPSPESAWTPARLKTDTVPVVAVFSISGPPHGSVEVQRIADAVMYASKQVGPLRVMVLGRNSDTGGEELRAALAGSAVEVTVLGIVPGEDVVRALAASDVLLFARGPISSNRGSAIAGIACGLPVIAQQGSVTSPLIAEAGVVLVPEAQSGGFGPALVHMLTDSAYRAALVARSKHAQTQYFSWAAIAAQYAKALRE